MGRTHGVRTVQDIADQYEPKQYDNPCKCAAKVRLPSVRRRAKIHGKSALPWQVVPLLAAALVLVGIGARRAPAATITTVAGGPGTGPATSLGQRPTSVAV